MRRLVHEMMARHVVARVEAVEIAAHLGEFFGAIGGQRLRRFIGAARARKLCDAIWSLEKIKDVRKLRALLVA